MRGGEALGGHPQQQRDHVAGVDDDGDNGVDPGAFLLMRHGPSLRVSNIFDITKVKRIRHGVKDSLHARARRPDGRWVTNGGPGSVGAQRPAVSGGSDGPHPRGPESRSCWTASGRTVRRTTCISPAKPTGLAG
nr:hypothetical protein GCM10020063_016370 [Dactylosporangium thailandense]